jgi:hypothetical protein
MRARFLPITGSGIGPLDGAWIMMSGRLGGISLPDNAFASLTVRVHRDRFELGLDRGIVVDGTIAPAALDVLIVAGPNQGRLCPASIERTGGSSGSATTSAAPHVLRRSGRRQVRGISWPRTGGALPRDTSPAATQSGS